MRTRHLAVMAISLALAVSACSGAKSNQDSGSTGNQAGNTAEGYEGNLTTSGLYAATWAPGKDYPADVFNSYNGVTLNSDKQTFASIGVKPDGSFHFASAATELSGNGAYTGTGAKVTLDKTNAFVCAFTIDTDLKGSTDNAVLHVKGSLKVHWHPQGIGDLSCP